jgi:adenylate cyclase
MKKSGNHSHRTAAATLADRLSPDIVRAQADRMATSTAFRKKTQVARILTYIVEKTLSGAAAELKGYNIAVEALGRPTDFDPQTDAVVRIRATQLRQALQL